MALGELVGTGPRELVGTGPIGAIGEGSVVEDRRPRNRSLAATEWRVKELIRLRGDGVPGEGVPRGERS